jgi:hypothetical protein
MIATLQLNEKPEADKFSQRVGIPRLFSLRILILPSRRLVVFSLRIVGPKSDKYTHLEPNLDVERKKKRKENGS